MLMFVHQRLTLRNNCANYRRCVKGWICVSISIISHMKVKEELANF
jgi:hypothetical protein